jgi:hypothetical protein
MGMGSVGCGYEYRSNNKGAGNGYRCPKLDKTRDGFYCRKFQEHLAWKELHEFTSRNVEDKTTVKVKHPIRTRKCHE